jgi:hypothetical protein
VLGGVIMKLTYLLSTEEWLLFSGAKEIGTYESRDIALRRSPKAELAGDEHGQSRDDREAWDRHGAAVLTHLPNASKYTPVRLDKRGFWRFRDGGKLVPEGANVVRFMHIPA